MYVLPYQLVKVAATFILMYKEDIYKRLKWMFIITTTTVIKVYHNNYNKIRSLLYREMISIYIFSLP
jgi:hypothetical protein